ncbi:acyl-CoA thioesterase [Alkalilimnicola ehrlichii]|uniref:Acyl-CoA thioesterase n=1 Tax=Alkalilimnicola ehrlichii TaxID=351052 RepID=A0A3E0WPK3_9GAMM|nr:thioesterase family protein [Alkalilimnicola ehrlichii]RFA26822.1 acyl-CoA thioesterase [Alkalilimnicola ehrlichii]RFA33916.1 acyl-CoA thioesterase [Alkalilimnicola ehrlichii]
MTARQTLHILDQAVALDGVDSNTYTGRTNPAYQNMIGPFGGVIGATLLNAIIQHPERLGEPVSFTVHYAAPISDGEFTVRLRIMRTNRSSQHWFVELIQEEQTAAFATAVTAIRRDTWGTTDAEYPQVPNAESVAVTPPLPHAPWTNCYEMRFIDGFPGVDEQREHPSQSRLWLRDQPPRPLDFVSLAAICDAFFPRLFVRRPKRVPFGTVALTTYFHADTAQLAEQGSAPVLGLAKGVHFGKGFFDQSAEIWGSDGALLASSHQIVYYKE